MNGIVPKQSSAITRSNTSVAPLSSSSSSSLFYQTLLINQLSFPTNSNSSASIGSSGSLHHSIYGKDYHNAMSGHHYHSSYGKGHPTPWKGVSITAANVPTAITKVMSVDS